jgi:hypothetical protein
MLEGAGGGAASGALTGLSVGGPWGALIGGVIGLGAGLFGGSKAAGKRRQAEALLARQENDNRDWYNRNVLGDYLQRSDTQSLLTRLRDDLRTQSKVNSSAAAVTGATPERQAADMERINRAVSGAYSQLGAMGQQIRDGNERVWLNRGDALAGQRLGMYNDQATGYENLMNNGMQSFTNAATAFADWKDSKLAN